MKTNKVKNILNVLRLLVIIWFIETLIALVLYSISVVVSNNDIEFILFINVMRFIYYYWLLAIVYFLRKSFSIRFFISTNMSVFIFISIIISLTIRGTSDLFLEYSFLCNFTAIILAPYLLKKLDSYLPPIFSIYNKN